MHRYVTGFLVAVICVLPVSTSAATAAELEAQIAQLSKVLNQLSAQKSAAQASAPCFVPTFDLSVGRTDAQTNGQVTQLQLWLKAEGFSDVPGTGYYGQKTAAAVVKWQKSHGLQAVGRVGPQTRAKIAQLCSASAPQESKIGVEFSVRPSYINLGESATLNWNATAMNAKSCVLSGGAYKNSFIPVVGTLSVLPDTGTIYIVSCYDGNEKVQAVPEVIDVKDISTNAYIIKPALTVVTNPAKITPSTPGAAANITWASYKTTACYLNGGMYVNQKVTASALGSVIVSPKETTMYTIYCTGINGEYLSENVSIEVVSTAGDRPL